MEDDEALPDNLRCSRTDGRGWRCTRRVMDNKKLCELHFLQARHRQYRQKVPESLKLQRKRNKKRSRDSESVEIRASRAKKLAKQMKRIRSVGTSEALDNALKKMKLRKGNLQFELIRTFLQRQAERRRGRELGENGGDLMRDLPNGLMSISSTPSPRHYVNAASSCGIKVGIDSASFTRRRFRSKNIEPLPIGSLQAVPYAQNVIKLRKDRRKKCHWCQKSISRNLVKCLNCQKEYFCMACIIERYLDKQGVKQACPVCRRTCSCKACALNLSKDVECKDILSDKNKADRILHCHYLICMLLPVLEQINQEQSIELEMEAKLRGKKPSEVQIQQAKFDGRKQCCCNNCKNSIADFHRSCPNCSYNLCLGCCQEFCRGSLPGGSKAHVFKHVTRRKSFLSAERCFAEMKHITNSKESGINGLSSSASVPNWRACNDDGSISCPPADFGGCGDSLLDLRCTFPCSWTKEMEASAEEIICSYEFPETSDVTSFCSICIGLDQKISGNKQLLEAATRENSSDNFLYFPAVQDFHGDSLEHFQKHWLKGHPVIIRNVIPSTSKLSWDPIVMFCTYLEKSISKSENDKNTVKDTNCLDWCEVEIGTRQLFMGSLQGHTHANKWDEMLKLKAWLSSHLFEELFSAHYAEIICALPLQEYLNPKSGLLNLAANLPCKISEIDLGPCVFISYGSPEERANSVTKLCYETHDVINILAHTTEAPISAEQLSKIKKLTRKHRTQDQREFTGIYNNQKTVNEVKQRSSRHSENITDVELLDMLEGGTCLSQGVSSASQTSAIVHEACDMIVKDAIMPLAKKYDSDSDASIRCIGTSLTSLEEQALCQDYAGNPNCFRKDLTADTCGAQWDVFRRQDVPKLLEYLRRHSKELGHTYGLSKHDVHPIHDQIFFLDTTHKLRLKEEFEIEPWTFVQQLGEAIIIPAGCPYQIRNLKSCVNVVLDFVSPENVTECMQLNDELHLLPDHHHKAKKGKLEVKKMALYGISEAIKEIRKLTCSN